MTSESSLPQSGTEAYDYSIAEHRMDSSATGTSDTVEQSAPKSVWSKPNSKAAMPYGPDGREFSAFESARARGLTRSYMSDNPWATVPAPPDMKTLQDDVVEPQNLPDVRKLACVGALNGSTSHEKWDIDRDTMQYLASVMAYEEAAVEDYDEYPTPLSALKVEEALLPTDPALDLARLKRRNTVDLRAGRVGNSTFDNSKHPISLWDEADLALPSTKDQEVAQERLEVTPDVLVFLKHVWELGEEPLDMACVVDNSVHSKLERLSPPLLPLSPPPTPGGLTGPAAEMELTSTPEDLTAIEAATLSEHIQQIDQIHSTGNTDESGGALDNAVASLMRINSSSSPRLGERIRDLKVDTPLLPASEERLPKRVKTVTFPEEISSIIPVPDHDEVKPAGAYVEEDIDAFMEKVLVPFAESAIQQTENEELVEFDTTMRIPQPAIDAIQISRPMDSFRGSEVHLRTLQCDFLSRMKRELCKGEERWAGVSKAEKGLQWSPFPSRLGKVQEEEFDDGSMTRYMAELSFDDAIDVQELIAYQLQDHDDEEAEEPLQPTVSVADNMETYEPVEEFTMAAAQPEHQMKHNLAPPRNMPLKPPIVSTFATTSPGRTDMRAILRKRKLEIEDGQDLSAAGPNAKRQNGGGHLPGQSDLLSRDQTSIEALSSFIRMQNGGEPHYRPPQSPHVVPSKEQAVREDAVDQETFMHDATQQCGSAIYPSPEAVEVHHKTAIILTSSMLAKRDMVRILQAQLPTVDLIERNPVSGSTTHTGGTTADLCEADVTASPTTGFILTTLQKTKQKALPGQADFIGIQERILSVSTRYTKLITLVSEGLPPPPDGVPEAQVLTHGLDQTDSAALADLMGLSALVNAELAFIYVPGGDRQLAQWLAAMLSHHVQPEGAVKLFHDETMWERFLRKAGMNAYAAQAVLATLKLSEGDDRSYQEAEESVYGLAAFVQMLPEQRMARLGALAGGREVLKSVNEVVDCSWSSA